MSKADLLKILEAVEDRADPWSDDHIESVVASAFRRLADDLSNAFDISDCECGRYAICGDVPTCPRAMLRDRGQ